MLPYLRKLIPVCALAVLCGCTSDDDGIDVVSGVDALDEVSVSVVSTDTVLSLGDVWKAGSNPALGEVTQSRSLGREIQTVESINDSAGRPLIYVINYSDDQGFVLLSSTKKTNPVLAHSDHGHFSVQEAHEGGLARWLESATGYVIEACDFHQDSLAAHFAEWERVLPSTKPYKSGGVSRSAAVYSEAEELIAQQIQDWQAAGWTVYPVAEFNSVPSVLGAPTILSEPTSQYSGDSEYVSAMENAKNLYCDWAGCSAYDISFVLVRNDHYDVSNYMIETTWDQTGYYSACTPNNYPVGCTAVSLGQIVRYYESLPGYDYSAMPNKATAPCPELARFLADVGGIIGVDYGEKGSGATISEQYAALGECGLTGTYLRNTYDSSRVMSSLWKHMPVILSGGNADNNSRHNWLCDGIHDESSSVRYAYAVPFFQPGDACGVYQSAYTYTDQLRRNTTVHMNWGWNGSYNGFYKDGFATPGYYDFSYYRHEIVDIKPIDQ